SSHLPAHSLARIEVVWRWFNCWRSVTLPVSLALGRDENVGPGRCCCTLDVTGPVAAICAHTFWITTQVLFDEVEHCGAVPRVGSEVRQGRRNDDLMLVVYGGLC